LAIPEAVLKGRDNRSVLDEPDVLRKFARVGETETFPTERIAENKIVFPSNIAII